MFSVPGGSAVDLSVTRADEHTTNVTLRVEGREVSRLILHRREMRIGCARVTMGGIGGVFTEPEHRHRGYMRRVMERAVQHMAEQQYDFSLLFGIRDFYPRWGFRTTMGFHQVSIPLEKARPVSSSLRTRPFEPTDMPAVLEIYAENNALRTGSIVRPPFPPDRFPMGSEFFVRPELFVVLDHAGEIIAYAGVDRDKENRDTGERTPITGRLHAAEAGARVPAAWPAIIARLAARAEELQAPSLEIFVPPDHELTHYARLLGCTVRSSYPDDGGAMGRIIDLTSLLPKIEPELRRRFRLSGAQFSGSCRVITDLGVFAIVARNGELHLEDDVGDPAAELELPQWALMQLLLGHRPLPLVLLEAETKARGDLTPLGAALFPPQYAHCWRTDWF